jgi:hypothetical protein
MSRHDAWEMGHKVRISDDLRYMRRPINYFGSDADIKQALQDLKDQGFCPDYVFTDTLSRSMLGGNERDEGHMTKVFTNSELFCQELGGAGNGFIHHDKKDGTGFRGSGAIFAMVEALAECKSAPEQGQTRTTLTCVGFKDAKPFDPVTVVYGSSTVETEEGPQEVPYVKGTVPGPKDEKQSKEMELMLTVFRMMGGRATRTEFAVQMRNFTAEKRGDVVVKEGWSDDTFDRRMKIFKTLFRVTGGGLKNEPFVLEDEPYVSAGDRPQNHPQRNPYIGIAGVAGDYGCPQSPADHPQTAFAGNDEALAQAEKTPIEDEAIALMLETAVKDLDEPKMTDLEKYHQEQRDLDKYR